MRIRESISLEKSAAISAMLVDLQEAVSRGNLAVESESRLRRENDSLREILGRFARAGYEQTWRYSAWTDGGRAPRQKSGEFVSIFVSDDLVDEAMNVLGVTEKRGGVRVVALEKLASYGRK